MRPPLSQPQCLCKKSVSPLLLPSGKLFDEWNRRGKFLRSPCRSFRNCRFQRNCGLPRLCICRNAKTAGGSGEPKGQWSRQPFSRFSSRYYSEQKAKVKSLLSLLLSRTSRALRFAPGVPKTLWKRKPHESADSRRNAETVARLRFSRMEQRWFRKELPVASRPRRSAAVIHVLRQRCKTVILFKPPHRRSVPSRTLTDAGPKTESRNIEWQCARLNGQNTAANGWSVDSPRCFKLKTQRIKIKSSLFCTAGSFP
jgi:hypothetical protein